MQRKLNEHSRRLAGAVANWSSVGSSSIRRRRWSSGWGRCRSRTPCRSPAAECVKRWVDPASWSSASSRCANHYAAYAQTHQMLYNRWCSMTFSVLWRSEWVSRVYWPHQHIIGHFGDESFQSITCWPPFLAVLCFVQLTQTNCWYHGPARPALDCVPSVLLVRLPGMTCQLICTTWTYL